jgi:hypothetical protein
MERCSPVEMRKNLVAVEEMKMSGIDFVPIPARDAAHKKELVQQCIEAFEAIITATNKD